MTDTVKNLVIVMSDEHAAACTGLAGHPIVKTPRIDAMAAGGTWFPTAYTNCPLCVPARASFATGQYVHEIGNWDNAMPYEGSPPSWGHRLQEAGVPVTSIGKLHYRNDDPAGFDEQIIPMHVNKGVGDIMGSIRDPFLPERRAGSAIAERVGPGESNYTRYDRDIAERAVAWIGEKGRALESPWVLYVGFVAPHFPLIAPEEFFALYDPDDMPLPKAYRDGERPDHPWLEALRACFVTDSYFDDERRRIAIAAYFGLCSFVDHNLGRVLDAVTDAGLGGTTDVIYTSDHGDNLGARGLWQKNNLYEESAAIPFVMSGPDIPQGKVAGTPISLVDMFPTILRHAGVAVTDDVPGSDIFEIMEQPDDPERVIFSEYHAAGAVSGAFMLRQGRFKYIHYVGLPPQLFDLVGDPDELNDLGRAATHADVVARFETMLRERLDPEGIDARAKADQKALVESHGGVEAILADKAVAMPGGTPPPGTESAF